MAYKVLAQDIASPFSHMCFYSLAQLSKKSEQLIGLKSVSPLQEVVNTSVRWCLEEKNTLALAKKIVKKLEKTSFYNKLIKYSYISLDKLHKIALETKNKDFSKYSYKKLASTLEKYLNLWVEATIWGHVINLSDFHFTLLSNKIMDLVEKRVKKSQIKLSAPEVFIILTTPIKRSILAKQDLNLFKLIKEIQGDKNLKDLFLKTEDLENQLKGSSFWKKIKAHTKKYDWLQYHYLGPTILTEDYFLELLKGLVKQRLNVQKEIKEITERKKQTIKRQTELEKKLNFNQKELYWLNMAKEFAYLKGLRKEITFIACRCYDSLLKEITRRFCVSLKQLQFMSPEEIFNALKKNKKPNADLLSQRVKYCVIYYPKNQVKVFVGTQAKKLAQRIKEEKIKKGLKEFKGSPAFPGKAKGEVVIVFEAKDMIKMQKRRVLVSPATNPNIMPAIVKAGAIITDEGGITCHAAIVSRELKIPCIIGTKIATKVLKDGDLVEVDATKGVIRILK